MPGCSEGGQRGAEVLLPGSVIADSSKNFEVKRLCLFGAGMIGPAPMSLQKEAGASETWFPRRTLGASGMLWLCFLL